jgi:hypothetical protein
MTPSTRCSARRCDSEDRAAMDLGPVLGMIGMGLLLAAFIASAG